jgi:DNA polymerase-3 subunit gamma/tau
VSPSTLFINIDVQQGNMMTTSASLNLARKFRPRTFQEVVGQDIPLSMLKNSLYKGQLFPVYLFSGQRGCGKTSTARILAAAINCHARDAFEKNPSLSPFPCLECESCVMMHEATHPDFTEIDAASNTGVDDVRALLESCSFLPHAGKKRIYLIDEVHMLSKAAFNAFLKMLEEPPAHTVFLMATTELVKIPETVRSRCFQLHFAALAKKDLHDHLAMVCKNESIEITEQALALIYQETDGSARDALNLIEQVRFSAPSVDEDVVRRSLGTISSHQLTTLLLHIAQNDREKLLTLCSELAPHMRAMNRIWQSFIHVLRGLLWKHYGVTPKHSAITLEDEISSQILSARSADALHRMLAYCWKQEPLFLSTPYKQVFFETFLLDLCQPLPAVGGDVQTEPKPSAHGSASRQTSRHAAPSQPQAAPVKVAPPAPKAAPTANNAKEHTSPEWAAARNELLTLSDPMLVSIFQQASFVEYNAESATVTLGAASASSFFKDKIDETKPLWLPVVQKAFPACKSLTLVQKKNSVSKQSAPTPATPKKIIPVPPPPTPAPAPQQKQQWNNRRSYQAKKPAGPPRVALTLDDESKKKWPLTAKIHGLFPGKIEISPSAEK